MIPPSVQAGRQGLRATAAPTATARPASIGPKFSEGLHPDPPDLKEVVDHHTPGAIVLGGQERNQHDRHAELRAGRRQRRRDLGDRRLPEETADVSDADYKAWTAPPAPPAPPAAAAAAAPPPAADRRPPSPGTASPSGRATNSGESRYNPAHEFCAPLSARPRSARARPPRRPGFSRSPMSLWPWRNSPSRCCSAASSMCWPARRPIRLRLTGPHLGCCLSPGWPSACSPSFAAPAVALYADRLAHRRRLLVLTRLFRTLLQLPLAYHGETHSGRLMKIMLQGADTLWSLLARVLPRTSRGLCLSVHPCAAVAHHQLAACHPADRPLRACSPMLTALVLRKTETSAEHRAEPIIPISPSAHPTRSATSHWCKASRASRPK